MVFVYSISDKYVGIRSYGKIRQELFVGNYIFDPSATNLSDRFLNRKKTRIC